MRASTCGSAAPPRGLTMGLELSDLVRGSDQPPHRRGPWTAALVGAVLTLFLLLVRNRTETDFDLLWYSASHLVRGVDPYPRWHEYWRWPLNYPLTAVLLAVPFTIMPLTLARLAWNATVGAFLGYALHGRERWRWGTFLSGAYVYATLRGQMTPLLVAAALIPSLGFLYAAKPNIGLAVFTGWPSRSAMVGAVAMLALTLAILPRWPIEWLEAISGTTPVVLSPVRRPFGWLLLLSALRWRTPEGRLLLALALIPQNSLPHDAIVLCLVPKTAVQMTVYGMGTWLAAAVTLAVGTQQPTLEAAQALVWPWLLGAVYLPMLILVLTRAQPKSSTPGPPIPDRGHQ
jgi:hypothetical protein